MGPSDRRFVNRLIMLCSPRMAIIAGFSILLGRETVRQATDVDEDFVSSVFFFFLFFNSLPSRFVKDSIAGKCALVECDASLEPRWDPARLSAPRSEEDDEQEGLPFLFCERYSLLRFNQSPGWQCKISKTRFTGFGR